MTPDLLLIGDGRLARHLARYFEQLGLGYVAWSRRAYAEGRCDDLGSLVHARTRALLAISDAAIEPFVLAHPRLAHVERVHFAGSLVTPLAAGAHPLFSFADTFYELETYRRIPFVIDRGSPRLTALIPGLPNPFVVIDPGQRPRYHAMCVLAGNFSTLLWRKLFVEFDGELGLAREHALPFLESITRGLAGPGAPLSGPLSRGDRVTIARNLAALRGDPFQQVYRAFVLAFDEEQRRSALACEVGR